MGQSVAEGLSTKLTEACLVNLQKHIQQQYNRGHSNPFMLLRLLPPALDVHATRDGGCASLRMHALHSGLVHSTTSSLAI